MVYCYLNQYIMTYYIFQKYVKSYLNQIQTFDDKK